MIIYSFYFCLSERWRGGEPSAEQNTKIKKINKINKKAEGSSSTAA
jgi:hypothetical protein